MDGFAIVPPNGGSAYVELSRSKKGRVFEKQILEYGDLLYPGVKGGKVHIDDDFADTLITNFTNKICDIVQVPKAGPKNEHSEDPDRNIGEVIGLSKRNNKIYAQIDARDADAADKLGKTLLGASAMMHLNYTDTKTGNHVGPTLLHVAVTNRPYVTDLEDFEEIMAASAPGIEASDNSSEEVVFLTAASVQDSKKGKPMLLDELISTLKSEHGIDVPELQTQAAAGVKLSNEIQEKLGTAGILKLSNGEEATADDLVASVGEAASQITELSNKVDGLVTDTKKDKATARVEGLIREGKIAPAFKDAQIELALSNPEVFEKLVPEQPIIALSQESGDDPVEELNLSNVQSEVDRIMATPAASAYVRS